MAPAKVSDSDVLAIGEKMNEKQGRVPIAEPKFSVGMHVHMKINFAKDGEQNYTTEVFRIIKVIRTTPRPMYELEDLNSKVIDGQFYDEDLTPFRITYRTAKKIVKILWTRIRRGIREYFVRWRGYGPDSDSWINAAG
jgi:hypothetical protein